MMSDDQRVVVTRAATIRRHLGDECAITFFGLSHRDQILEPHAFYTTLRSKDA